MRTFWFLTFLTLISCQKKNNLEDISVSKNVPTVFLPNAGCPGCISQTEDFLIRFKGSSCVNFVLVNVTSIKSLQIKLGIDVTNYGNISINNSDIYAQFGLSGFYPFVYFPDIGIKEVSPSNPNTLDDLESLLIDDLSCVINIP